MVLTSPIDCITQNKFMCLPKNKLNFLQCAQGEHKVKWKTSYVFLSEAVGGHPMVFLVHPLLPQSLQLLHPTPRFRMVVEGVREGVLVIEDEQEPTQYCSLSDGEGKGCMGVAELDASDIFALCKPADDHELLMATEELLQPRLLRCLLPMEYSEATT
ncbi:hypothetical protein GOP47_0000072 [Adiantum capillus-veneris]|uniref:Uncharacterized protein n=1 Tax=Adiantum capillus-veneris TaxID=13818 RepID=A0A9D4ZQC9_ADICA|nr:hypothetical protein GOP47_0000072 [Adiantum capillus-veneris]